MTPADLLASAGRALYGERWLMRLGRDLGVSDDTLTRWMKGRTELHISHGVFVDTAALLRQRAAELIEAAEAIERAQESGSV